MIIDRAASEKRQVKRPEIKRPGQEIPDRGALLMNHRSYNCMNPADHISFSVQLHFCPGPCGFFYFFPEETDMRKKSMPKTKKMAMEATP